MNYRIKVKVIAPVQNSIKVFNVEISLRDLQGVA